jgi:hypothetical protein
VTALAVGLPLALLVSGVCLAGTHSIDQKNPTFDTSRDEGTEQIAQTFTVGMTGTLDQVDLQLYLTDPTKPGSATAIIEAVDGSGNPVYPVGSPLSTGTHAIPLAAHTVVPFTMTPLAVTAGQQYAIVVTPTTFFTADYTHGTDRYNRGKGYEGTTGWNNIGGDATADWTFQTWVTPAAPAISAAFAAPSMTVGQAVAITFTITNGVGDGLIHGVGFITDTLPSGLSVSNGSESACGGGTFTRTSPSGIVLSGGSLADGASCQVSAMVTGNAAGSYTITTGNVSSTENGTGNTATASINVDAYPSVAAAFNPSSVAVGATTQLTITITNPAGNPDTLRPIDLADTLPAGLTVASAAAVTTCGAAGSLTVTAPSTIALFAASVATGSPCVFAVPVTGAVAGTYTDTVTARLGGSDYTGNKASAGLGVAAAAPTPTPTPAPTPTPTPAPTPTPTPAPTKAPTPPPTSTGVGPGSDNTGGTIWFLPFALVAAFGGLLILVDRRRRRII